MMDEVLRAVLVGNGDDDRRRTDPPCNEAALGRRVRKAVAELWASHPQCEDAVEAMLEWMASLASGESRRADASLARSALTDPCAQRTPSGSVEQSHCHHRRTATDPTNDRSLDRNSIMAR